MCFYDIRQGIENLFLLNGCVPSLLLIEIHSTAQQISSPGLLMKFSSLLVQFHI